MMVVVADTSPINYLVLIGEIDLAGPLVAAMRAGRGAATGAGEAVLGLNAFTFAPQF
jgi:hypothetical protein